MASEKVQSKQGYFLHSSGRGIHRLHYFLYTREVKLMDGESEKSNTYIAYGYKSYFAKQMTMYELCSIVDTFEM